MLMASIPTGDLVAVASSPNDIGIGQIRNGEAGLATAHTAIPSRFLRIHRHAGTAHVSVVLHIAVEIVGDLVVDVDVVHLADWKSHAVEAAAVNGGDDHPGIISDHKTIWIGGVDPDIVSVSAPADFLKILAAIERLMKRAVGNVHLVIASRRNCDSDVITGTSNQGSLEIDRFPVCSRVVGPPNRTLVLGLNQGEYAPGVCWRDGDVNLADRRMRQAVFFDAGPLRSAVA